MFDLSLDPFSLGGSGVCGRRLNPKLLSIFQKKYLQFHAGECRDQSRFNLCGQRLLDAFITHIGKEPQVRVAQGNPRGRERIVARARAFIHANLSRPISIESIAKAAATSQRTLHRCFLSVLEETPYSYTLKVRLHRIRNTLISDDELSATVAAAANRWGVTDLGRFAGRYEELFGELPSRTRALRRPNPIL